MAKVIIMNLEICQRYNTTMFANIFVLMVFQTNGILRRWQLWKCLVEHIWRLFCDFSMKTNGGQVYCLKEIANTAQLQGWPKHKSWRLQGRNTNEKIYVTIKLIVANALQTKACLLDPIQSECYTRVYCGDQNCFALFAFSLSIPTCRTTHFISLQQIKQLCPR